MADYGANYTDQELVKLEKRIKKVYGEAAKDIETKMNSFTAKSKAKEQKYSQKVANGEMTQAEFDKWKAGQVFQGKQWQAKKEEIATVLYNANTVASAMANNTQFNVFAANANFASYQMEQGAGVNFGFSLYDQNTVIRLIKDEPNLLPNYKPKKSKDITWNTKKITRQITQGIIQGESLDKISKRLAQVTASQNMNSMKTHARTLMTGAQNAGRLNSYENAQKLGIEMEKQWMATLDAHTRDTHKGLDGETVPVKDTFSNGLMYPGDPDGDPAEVYNCRCTMVSDIKKYPSIYNRYDNQSRERIRNMSYKDWEDAKKAGKSMVPYSIDKIKIESLFEGLSQNGAYTMIHDVDVKLSNQFYKELQEMGKNYDTLAKPSAVWNDYLNGNLPDGVSEKKLEKIMAEYKDKASKISIAPGEALTPKIDYSKFGGKEVFDILNKYENADQLFLFGGKDLDKVFAFDKHADLSELMKDAKAAQNSVSKPIKAPKTAKTVKTPPTPKDAVKSQFKTAEDWLNAAKKNPDIDGMLKLEKNSFKKFTKDEAEALRIYSGSAYREMNNYLRYKATGLSNSEAAAKAGIRSSLIAKVEKCQSALSKSKLEQDLVLRRGTDVGDLAGLFMKGNFSDNYRELSLKDAGELNKMFQGAMGEYAGFTSTSSQWNKGFSSDVECVIYAPKGTPAASIMGISNYGTAEGETLLNAGTKVVCEKIEKSDGHKSSDIRVFLRIIP